MPSASARKSAGAAQPAAPRIAAAQRGGSSTQVWNDIAVKREVLLSMVVTGPPSPNLEGMKTVKIIDKIIESFVNN